jgi:two-component system, OmpR family, response regulator
LGERVKILVIEDDAQTLGYIERGLRAEGHVVDPTANGRDGLLLAAAERYDVVIVDRMLPGLDGLAIVKTIRSAGVKSPVLFLTALGGIDDRVAGLAAGADDYLVKPFAFAELLARVHALARRPPLAEPAAVLRVEDLEMDLIRRTVVRADGLIELQPQEFRLLEFLMRNAGRIVTRAMLLESVWDFHFDPRTSVVETHISRLRAKIDRGFETPLLHTVRGAGYRLGEPR